MEGGTRGYKGLRRPRVAKHPKRTYYDKGLSPSNTENKFKYAKKILQQAELKHKRAAKLLMH
jgi:hypothetical protein